MECKRKLIVPTAQGWYEAALDNSYTMSERLLSMENALNHTENALFASRKERDAALDREGRLRDRVSYFIKKEMGAIAGRYWLQCQKCGGFIASSAANDKCTHCGTYHWLCGSFKEESRLAWVAEHDEKYQALSAELAALSAAPTGDIQAMRDICEAARSIDADLSGNADSRLCGVSYIMVEYVRVKALLDALARLDKKE